MRVRLRTLVAGPDGVFPPGSVIEVPTEEAEALIAGGFADWENSGRRAASPETASVEPGAKAVKPQARARRAP